MIHFFTGDFWSTPAGYLVNTVNCVGIMGKGIARDFRDTFPEMYECYVRVCSRGELKPGGLMLYNVANRGLIINFATKDHWRQPSQYGWVGAGLVQLRLILQSGPQLPVNLPALGCANGGLDFTVVRQLIKQHLGGLPHLINVFNPPGFNDEQWAA